MPHAVLLPLLRHLPRMRLLFAHMYMLFVTLLQLLSDLSLLLVLPPLLLQLSLLLFPGPRAANAATKRIGCLPMQVL